MKKLFMASIMLLAAILIINGCGKDDDDNGTGPSGDTEAPTVSITNPADGHTTSGTVTIEVEASDNEGVSKVELLIDGTVESTDNNHPYSFTVDFSSYSEGSHNVVAKAYDNSDNTTNSDAITINYSTDTESPSVTITSPASGHTTSGSVTITVEASDNEEVTEVELLIDGTVESTDSSAPYSFNIDFSSYSEGAHSVVAKAYDGSDNSSVSDAITIVYEWDFWPDGNGAIKIDIVSYEEEPDYELDGSSCGDPYFYVYFGPWHGAMDTVRIPETGYWENYCSLTDVYWLKYDVPDTLKDFMVVIDAYDYDPIGANDHLDCWSGEEFGGVGASLNTQSNTFPVSYTSDGEDDGNSGEKDCEISIRIELIERDWATKNKHCGP